MQYLFLIRKHNILPVPVAVHMGRCGVVIHRRARRRRLCRAVDGVE